MYKHKAWKIRTKIQVKDEQHKLGQKKRHTQAEKGAKRKRN